jgi:paraquat-inducible protein B
VGEPLPPDPYDKVRILAERGLRCQLATESLVTGQLMVEMGFFPDSPGHLKGIDVGYPELPTQASDFEQLAEKMKKLPIEEIFGKVLKAVARIESFLSNPELADIVHNLKTASEKLDTVMSGVDGVVEGADVFVRRLDRQVEPLSGGAQAAIRDARNLMNHLDREVGQLAPKLQETLASAKNTLDQAGQTLATYEDLVDDKSALRNNLNTTLIEISAAAQSLQTFLDYLEQHPEALLQGKGSGGGQ